MNLVSYEYMACQRENHGVLVISEYAGAADALSGGALVVNPWDSDEFSKAINDAILMKDQERKEKYETSIQYIDKHTRYVNLLRATQIHEEASVLLHIQDMKLTFPSFYWGRTFLKALKESSQAEEKFI